MKIFYKMVFVSIVLAFTSACTIRHPIESDYPLYLSKNSGETKFPKTNKANLYYLSPHAQSFTYEFRAFATGEANLWVVEFGKMLEDTIKSSDIQAAFGGINKAENANQPLPLLVFEVTDYTFQDFGAHIKLHVSLQKSGSTLFEKEYDIDGRTQGKKMFWGGAFAQKNAVQQSTKSSLDEIFTQLIRDLNAAK